MLMLMSAVAHPETWGASALLHTRPETSCTLTGVNCMTNATSLFADAQAQNPDAIQFGFKLTAEDDEATESEANSDSGTEEACLAIPESWLHACRPTDVVDLLL